MKKEILELVVLGLQTKERFSTENIVNALASLSEEQQYQWIETMLSNNQIKSNVKLDTDNSTTHCILQVITNRDTARTNLAIYLKNSLNFTLHEAKNLVFGDSCMFELTVNACDSAKIIKDLEQLNCTVTQN